MIKPYSFESRFLDLDGIKYHYLDEGQGDPILMLHGNPTWSFYYRNLVTALRDDYRTIVPDHVGCGLSDKPGDDKYEYSLKRRVDDVEALMDHLGIRDNITLVLHDWGGMIGMAFASRYPDRIKRLVILNTSAFRLPESKPFPWPLWLSRTPVGGFLIRGFNAFAATAANECCKRNPLSKEVKAAYLAPYNSWENRIATLRFVQDIPLKPGEKAWDIVTAVEEGIDRFKGKPMIIFWGEKDFVFDVHFLNKWLEHFPEADVHRYPDYGHYILEDAKDEIIPLVKKFLKDNPLNQEV